MTATQMYEVDLRGLQIVAGIRDPDKHQYGIGGVRIEGFGDHVVAVATDGKIMLIHETPICGGAPTEGDGGFTIPREVIDLLCTLPVEEGQRLKTWATSKNIFIGIPGGGLIKVEPDEFPDWRGALQAEFDDEVPEFSVHSMAKISKAFAAYGYGDGRYTARYDSRRAGVLTLGELTAYVMASSPYSRVEDTSFNYGRWVRKETK